MKPRAKLTVSGHFFLESELGEINLNQNREIEIRRVEFLAVGEPCKAMFWAPLCFKERTLPAVDILSGGDLYLCISGPLP